MKLVFDVGGTAVKYGVADETGNFVLLDSIPTPKNGAEEFLDRIEALFHRFSGRYVLNGAAFSFPGEVHEEEGVIHGISAVQYLHELPLKKLLTERFGGIAVSMENDANCAALGEFWKGIAKDSENVVFVICGTGIGGAVIEHGRLYTGMTRNRGEFGNFPMGGLQNGTLLTWSDYTLEKQARKYSRMKQEEIGIEVPMNGMELCRCFQRGDGLAAQLLEEFYYWMAVGCITLEFAFDPELIAIGGGISANKMLMDGIRRKVKNLLDGQRPGYLRPRIEACRNGNQANLYGALYHHLIS